jgi:hypothetical protein
MGAPNNSTNTDCQRAASVVAAQIRQGIRLGPLLLIRHLLRRRPVMYPDRLTRITSRCHPFTTMINCLSFTENPLLTRTNVQITADSFELLPDENWSRYAGFRSRRSRWNVR